jgi:hypothetical protein
MGKLHLKPTKDIEAEVVRITTENSQRENPIDYSGKVGGKLIAAVRQKMAVRLEQRTNG